MYLADLVLEGRCTGAYLRKASSSDIFVFFQVFIAQGYKPLLDFLKQREVEPTTIVDAGANVGYFSILINSLYPDAKIVCIEPSESNVNCLKKNIKHCANNVEIVPAALWSNDRKLEMKNEHAEEWTFQLTDRSPSAGKYDGISLTSLMMKFGLQKIDILKIDIEGAEAILFSDMDFISKLDKVAILAMEIHDHFANRLEIHDRLNESGFGFFEQGELTVAYNLKWFAQ